MIKPWKILESRQTYKDDFLSVRTDVCQREDGHVVPAYHVLEFTDWATIIPITDEGNIVLVREYRHAGEIVLLGVPGGVLDPGESDPEIAARRELREETGYMARELIPVGTCYPNPATQNNQLHYFLATGCQKTDAQSLDANEKIEVVEMPYKDFLEYEAFETQHGLHAAALFYTERYFGKHPEKRP
ncbi:MAG TPA: DNA mismatch repair protein MutT [Hyphomonas sp.]|jgi:8-oxo-dGTP pyrophosphatase MutT (NUDIX family)|uniref:NUDIX hydrolase n=2 Tax=unclassified Hyphomonas TaxID=2630699 RepID=UPI000C8AACCE|nr:MULTISPECIES: NUDIX hydrolase [unclassified Hyphomonas]MAL44107.1 DNA mismatch repair protein MutT [Hyphomonas sp.]HAO35092.1 DNA mismatch repair protein MutT [Hyphomonas sp.]HAW56822.1 DNA mismatch repair protein MutT [Hyphomonas sp.]HBJ41061.1 DNA mismatch repair protein MutT [Hyphomonas sp.]HBU33590.1 DNA mismatch repair protein MutT [Hyphomonas sp.]|tara:strand:+ start:9856 stop:10416 length:561 start_codon:yes stop_codon:yes gene_type:complete